MIAENPSKTRRQLRGNRLMAYALVVTGLSLIVVSVFRYSTPTSVVGLGLMAWGIILLYIMPRKLVSLALLKASAGSTIMNIEPILVEKGSDPQGIYLSPRHLEDYESSRVLVASSTKPASLSPKPRLITGLSAADSHATLLIPPGLALSRLIEREYGVSFTKTDLTSLAKRLPHVIVEELEMAEEMEIVIETDTIHANVKNHLLNEECIETRKLEKTHAVLGCVFTSALACIFAKAAGKSLTIEKEEHSDAERWTRIEFRLVEES